MAVTGTSVCGDGIDNDGDNDIDCNDSNYANDPSALPCPMLPTCSRSCSSTIAPAATMDKWAPTAS